MANVAQLVNMLQGLVLTHGARMVPTPTHHVFEMCAAHQGVGLELTDPARDGRRPPEGGRPGAHVLHPGAVSRQAPNSSMTVGGATSATPPQRVARPSALPTDLGHALRTRPHHGRWRAQQNRRG